MTSLPQLEQLTFLNDIIVGAIDTLGCFKKIIKALYEVCW